MTLKGSPADRTMAHQLIFLLLSCLCYGATSLDTAVIGPLKYCHGETFEATCPEDHVIIMQSAVYGLMSVGRCVKLADFGYIGCQKDVLRLMDSTCSGRRSCQVKTNAGVLLATKPCPDERTAFLKVSYSCIPDYQK